MKIRIMGTIEEIKAAEAYYLSLRGDSNVQSVEVSKPYANRAPSLVYRLYVEVIYRQSGKYQQRYSPAEPWRDVTEFGARSALTCNGAAWGPVMARLEKGETVKTEFAEYRLLKEAV